MTNPDQAHTNYDRVEKAIRFIADHHKSQPTLEDIANNVGVSKFYLQRIFSEWAGVSPKQFLQYLTKEYAKKKLRETTVLDSAIDSGLSGSGRLHDLFINHESVTPGEYKVKGKELNITFGIHNCVFGYCFIANTHRGICKLSFSSRKQDIDNALSELHSEWGAANIRADAQTTAALMSKIFNRDKSHPESLRILLKGSPFQIKVWEALLKIPEGYVCSYQTIAAAIGNPSATRSVASAIGKNSIGYLIPCHRVIRSTGVLSNYRWGSERKAAMIGWEQSRINHPP